MLLPILIIMCSVACTTAVFVCHVLRDSKERPWDE
jgi:hypothetical protein